MIPFTRRNLIGRTFHCIRIQATSDTMGSLIAEYTDFCDNSLEGDWTLIQGVSSFMMYFDLHSDMVLFNLKYTGTACGQRTFT